MSEVLVRQVGGILFAMGMLTLSAPGAAAEDYVILDSDAQGIEPGIVVAAKADIVIPEGATLVVIDPSGETLEIRGPYSGPMRLASSAEGASIMERMTTTRERDTKVLGAVRSVTVDGGSVTE